MRVLQAVPQIDKSPEGRATLDLGQELVRLGHESIVVSAGGELMDRLVLRGSRHIEIPLDRRSLWSLRLVRRLRRLIRELEVDVVHARAPLPGWLLWLAVRGIPEGQRPRFVTSVHRLYGGGFFNSIMAAGQQVMAVSGFAGERLRKQFSRKLASAPEIVPGGVNTREFDRSAPVSGYWHQRLLNDFPQLEGRNWLLMPAALSPGNGHREFLQLLSMLGQQRDDVFGLIVGEVPPGDVKYARKLERLALDLGLSDKVLFMGPRRDMRELYASARITFCLGERPLAYGRVAAEALAMGCPVIAYRLGGLTELLQQCFPQGLVDAGDTEALLEASMEVLKRPVQVVSDGLSLEDMSARVLALYARA
ncbi:GDP-mannose-dependent alpha-(1-6)-phosphatidylinositol monomannoside mannosyltransferase [Microbulbifer aggregans]|uniref:GDP-mannose-dependent alpha-(1-6)-phosphatidylinositol monomannoside mannosyltransferase n=2 Tax=Microbulbifer aggregans TaxID=1769779 RepID=A0A1C9WB37_9GAMM|nr:GDP-mannose-dependent alpha-(1-6)-phosphatidylinositol monomannoside mannosyltransferase [Microbulbifer aggregans]